MATEAVKLPQSGFMRTFGFVDGMVEIESSGCCCAPGQKHKGQHTNSCTTWYRINGTKWERADSVSRLLKAARESKTLSDFYSNV